MKWLMLLLSIGLGAVGQVLMKWGLMFERPIIHIDHPLLRPYFSWPVLLGLFSYGISAITWILALRNVELSVAYPMVSLGYVIVVFASYFLLHEPISIQKIVGLVFICIGVIVLSMK